MSGASLSCCKWSMTMFGFTLAALLAMNAPLHAQDSAPSGIADDWSHHHAVFSTPSGELDALKSGHYRDWLSVVKEPRYITQQQKRKSPIVQSTVFPPLHRPAVAPGGFGDLFSRRPPTRKPIPSSIHKDWSMSDGTTSIAANAFPAKYSFSTTTASCNDYIVYPTGGTAATLVAYKNSMRAHAAAQCPRSHGRTTQPARQRSRRCFRPTAVRSPTFRSMRTSHRWSS